MYSSNEEGSIGVYEIAGYSLQMHVTEGLCVAVGLHLTRAVGVCCRGLTVEGRLLAGK